MRAEEEEEEEHRAGTGTGPQPPEGDREPGTNGEDAQTDSSATVKVVLVPGGHVMTVAFAIDLSIQELKVHLSAELRVPAQVLLLSLDGRVLEEGRSLRDLGVRPHGSTRLEMSSSEPTSHPLRPLRPLQDDNMRDVITVRVPAAEGDAPFQEVVVEIERPRHQKLFLGGYRGRTTGQEYHHAAVQTLPKKIRDRGVVRYCRNTQTVEQKCRPQQCTVSVATQMTAIGCYVSCANDKLLSPGDYVSAEQYHARRLRAVIRLQTLTRRWLAQQKVERLRRERQRRLLWMELQERRRHEEKEQQLRERRRRWMNPQTKEDLNLLYNALEKWRSEEEEQINLTLSGGARRAALCALLAQEAKLIADIGSHRHVARKNNITKFLDKSAMIHRWRGADGRMIEMDSPHTVRARQLRDLFNNVKQPVVSREQRLEVLMTLKHTVMEYECELVRDLEELIDREVDLMSRGVKAVCLDGLRERTCTLLLQFIKTPAFNPEVAKLLKVPQDPSQLKNGVVFCVGCRRYLSFSSFKTTARARPSGRCRDCARLVNIAQARDDFSCYRDILRSLRDEEHRSGAHTHLTHLLQADDIQYLVKEVWASRSALQGSRDLYDLVLVRWDHLRPWSPWNCILLSKEETRAHLEVQDLHKAYDVSFIESIEHKHMVARRHFHNFPDLAKYLVT